MTLPHVFTTKSELAHQHIQRMILSGELRPGDRLKSREVSERLGISETPIREAIRALASEGWLEMTNHVGAVVQGLKVEQIHEISTLRGEISALAIRLNGPVFDAAMLARLTANVEAMSKEVDAGNVQGFAELNDEFHRLLCDGPNSPWCAKILESILGLISHQRHGILPRQTRLVEAVSEHRRIVDFLQANDFHAAAAMAKEHERNAGLFLIQELNAIEAARSPA